MPCDTVKKKNQTPVQRKAEIDKALARLEQQLQLGQIQLAIGANGAVAFTNWQDRDGVTDVCAYRTLSAKSSWALRQAVAKAEVMTGRKVSMAAVGAGIHSHDGGKTWNHGH